MKRDGRQVEDIDELSGLSQRQPLLAFVFAMLLFSLAGIPPLAGFFAKWYVFAAAIKADLYWLAVVGVVTSWSAPRLPRGHRQDVFRGAGWRLRASAGQGCASCSQCPVSSSCSSSSRSTSSSRPPTPRPGRCSDEPAMSPERADLPPGYRLIFHEAIGSTNAEALRLAGGERRRPLDLGGKSARRPRPGRAELDLAARQPPCEPAAAPGVPLTTASQLSPLAGIAAYRRHRRACGNGARIPPLQLKWPNDRHGEHHGAHVEGNEDPAQHQQAPRMQFIVRQRHSAGGAGSREPDHMLGIPYSTRI